MIGVQITMPSLQKMTRLAPQKGWGGSFEAVVLLATPAIAGHIIEMVESPRIKITASVSGWP